MTGEPASADVVVLDSASYCFWTLRDLQTLQAKNPTLYNRFIMIVGKNVAEKLRQLTHSSFVAGERGI